MPTSNPYAARLPDTYAKAEGTNNEKLLRLPYEALLQGYADVADTADAVSLDLAFGKTLDYYGEMVGQARGAMNDTQYRYLIRNRISRSFVVGDYESVLDGIVAMFEAGKDEIVLDDDAAESGAVHVTRLPFAILDRAGFTASQALQMIALLLPAGVRVWADNFEGTFAFGASEDEYDEAAGFADDPDDPTMGGYLGFVFGEDEATPLPL